MSVISWHFKLGCKCFDPISELDNIFVVVETFDKIFLQFSIFPLYTNTDLGSPQKKICDRFEIGFHTTSGSHSRSTCKDQQRKASLVSVIIQWPESECTLKKKTVEQSRVAELFHHEILKRIRKERKNERRFGLVKFNSYIRVQLNLYK